MGGWGRGWLGKGVVEGGGGQIEIFSFILTYSVSTFVAPLDG